MKHRRILLFAVLTCLAVAGMAWLVLPDDSMCGNQQTGSWASPDATRRVVVFRRDCGATTGFSTHVSLLGVGDPLPPGGGNVFVADSDHGRAPEGACGGPVVAVEWMSNQALTIRHHPEVRVFKKEVSAENVRVQYAVGSPTAPPQP